MLKNKCQNFWLLILATLASSEFWLLSRETPVASLSRSFHNSLATRENFRDSFHDSLVTKHLETAFLKCFLWETCFKPLPFSLKPLFQYFYIKTQSIWMVFHSINISKIILNSFHWFGSLDYVLESFVSWLGFSS